MPSDGKQATLAERHFTGVTSFVPTEEISMSTHSYEKKLRRCIYRLFDNDPQYAAARPDDEITVATSRPGLRLPRSRQP
jgi:hypothetical protein